MFRFVVFLLLCGTLAQAKDEAAMARVREIYQAWQKAMGEPPPGADLGPDATEAVRQVMASRPTVASVNRAYFGKEFAKLPFGDWDADEDADIVREGLLLTARNATSQGMPDRALKAGARFAKQYPEHADVAGILGWHRPAALLALKRFDEAKKQLETHVGKLKLTMAARAWTLLGDMAAVTGEVGAAQKHYEKARAFVWKDGEFDIESVPRALQMYVRSANIVAGNELDARERYIGGRLPKLTRSVGIGPVTKALARTPRVVILYFFSPSDATHMQTLVELDRMADEFGPERLSVVAVTWYEGLTESDGKRWMHMPKDKVDIVSPKGVHVEPRHFRRELQKLRRALHLSIPFATMKEKNVREWLPDRKTELVLATDVERRVLLAMTGVGMLIEANATPELTLLRALLAAQPAPKKKKD